MHGARSKDTAGTEQVVPVAPVPLHVGIELALPELFASGRCCRVRTAGMPVPETAVNETHSLREISPFGWSP